MVDLSVGTQGGMLSKDRAIDQIDNYLNKFIKNGFDGIKTNLFTNSKIKMYNAAHSQIGCTRMIGLLRLGMILNYMQHTVPIFEGEDVKPN